MSNRNNAIPGVRVYQQLLRSQHEALAMIGARQKTLSQNCA